MQRKGSMTGIKPERIADYVREHANVWPEVLARIEECNIKNYTIFLREPENLLFAYFEYHGTDFEADMAKMREHEVTRKWWELCGPMQEPLSTRAEGEWWAPMREVFHTD